MGENSVKSMLEALGKEKDKTSSKARALRRKLREAGHYVSKKDGKKSDVKKADKKSADKAEKGKNAAKEVDDDDDDDDDD